jgi:DNA-binding NtrC family response regulator
VSARVLVIDDEPSIRHALERALRWCGHEVLVASGADSAYELLSETPADLVLLDVRMPQMTGDTLYFALVRRWPRLRTRVVFMSGDPEHCRDEWPEELRQRRMLAKPFALRELETLIASVLAEQEEPLSRRNSGSA